MFLLIENGEVYTPRPARTASVLAFNERLTRIGPVDRHALEATGLPLERIDAAGCIVAPALIDPHEHLIGGSGEKGWASQTPEIFPSEVAAGGIGTVVGCLGVDTVTKTMPALLARVRAFAEYGFTALLWSGGYDVPPRTLTGSVHTDMLYVPEVIGAGEIAISDERSTEPTTAELARVVKSAHTAGTLAGKAGLTHFHVGEGRERLAPLRRLLDEHEIRPEWLYPTHVERSEALMAEAVDLSRAGATIDVDVIEADLAKWFRFYLDRGGAAERFTASTDAAITGPGTLLEQVRDCVLRGGFRIEDVLPIVTSNTARVLKLPNKGRLEPAADADIIVLERDTLELRDVFLRGRALVRDGAIVMKEHWLSDSSRRICLHAE